MWSYKLFRIGALVLVLCGFMHLFGHLGSKGVKPVNSYEYQLEEVMYGYKTNVMGTMRSKGDLYDGYSLGFSVSMLSLAALGFTVRTERKTAIIFAVSLAAMLGLSITYWFTIPTAFLGTALLCYAGSAYLDKK